jgi:HK97 family phage portal protein
MFASTDIEPIKRGPFDDFWFTRIGVPSAAGVLVSPQTALSLSTFYSCCLVLGQTLATVPVHLYRRRAPRGKERATEHPLYRLIHRKPNRWQTSFQWRQMMQWHVALRYNAYSRIIYDKRAMPMELVPLHPDRVTVERIPGLDGVESFRYLFKPRQGDPVPLSRFEVFHVRGLTSDGIEGLSQIELQKDSIGEAIAAQKFSGRRMQNDARPGGVLEWEGHFPDDIERGKFRRSWQEAQAGENQGKTAVLEKGMTWKEIGVKNTDLQFIELRKLKAQDIAAIFRMPPHKVGLLENATFSNIEHQGIEFVTDTMLPWFVNWEQELSVQLLTDEEQEEYFFEFLADGLLRGDSKARGEFYGKRFSTGSLSPNDIRELESENPVPGGDRYFVPVNMIPLDRADDLVDKGAAQPAAPAPGEDAQRERDDEQAAEAGGVVRREIAQVSRKGAPAEVEAFYAGHAAHVAERMEIDEGAAADYCAMRIATYQAAHIAGRVDAWLAELEADGVHQLLKFVRAASA